MGLDTNQCLFLGIAIVVMMTSWGIVMEWEDVKDYVKRLMKKERKKR